MISPDTWRKYFKPRLKRIIDAIRQFKPGTIIAFHSCGSILPIIGELAEVGVDVLNPVQESAKGMQHAVIKEQYGAAMTLMCGMETQQFMPFATPEQVAEKTREKAALLRPGGGFIFAASHTIQSDVSVENALAMFDALDTL